MANNEVFDRTQILGSAAKDYDFDKVLRGYDIKQVDTYIDNLLQANKNASEIFDNRFNDLKNENSMLACELGQVKSKLAEMTALFENCRKERDELKNSAGSATSAVDTAQIDELNETVKKLTTKNRLLADENKKLESENSDLQRDVAHLTKKVDKNRAEIKSLSSELESSVNDDLAKKYSEISRIYESAVDKAEDLIYRLQTELSLAHSKAEDVKSEEKE